MQEVHLKVMLSKDRNQSGLLQLVKDGRLLTQYEALGRGSRGAGDTQMMKNGNTPTGECLATQVVSTKAWAQRSYGPNGAIRLQPLAGKAVKAAKESGRSGLLIHGGSEASSK